MTNPDLERCEAIKPNPYYNPFSFGENATRRQVRCKEKPTVIVTETHGQKQGQMSLCDNCLSVAKKQTPNELFSIKTIE